MPPELSDAPELWPENRVAWRAWLFLHDLRAPGEAIRLADIESYGRIYGVRPGPLAEKLKAIEQEFNSRPLPAGKQA
jgi:hypothetical protein